jgi:hypothetical protein
LTKKAVALFTSSPISPSPFYVENPARGGGEGFILKGFTLKGTKGEREKEAWF